MTCTDNESKNSRNEWIPDGEVDERQSARTLKKLDRREVGKRRSEVGRERVSVAGGLGATPIGHSVEQVDDPVAKLQDADG